MSDTTGLKARLKSDLTEAMRAKDKLRVGTLRMVLTSINKAEVAGTEHHDLTDDEVLKVVAKEAKTRRETAQEYADAGRPELAEQELAEHSVLEAYLPAQLTDDELAGIVEEAVTETGATSMKEMGQVMKTANAKVAGRADGGRVAAAVKARLQQG